MGLNLSLLTLNLGIHATSIYMRACTYCERVLQIITAHLVRTA